MQLKITTAGRTALLNASRTGTNSVKITQIGLTSQAFTPKADGSDTALPGEFKRLSTFGGKATSNDTIHVTIRDESNGVYTLRGIALYLDNGVLFGIYGQAGAILEKAAPAMMLLSADVKFTTISATSITFGNADFLNPIATTDQVGVVELATITEAEDGNDTARAVTPRGLRAYIDKRFGASAPTTFARNILAMATATALRQALELGDSALKNMGHGKGLDADTLDGMHAADFPQVGKVQPIDAIPGNSNQVRWIKLGTLPWRGAAASILLLEMTNGAIGSPRYAWEQIAASTRTFSETTTALTQAIVDGMVQHTRIGADSSLDRPSRFGLVLTTDAAGKSTGVELWLQQREYNQGHAVRVVNATGATYHGPGAFVTTEPQGIIYATAQPLAYMGDLRRLVESTENRWGRRQTLAQGLYLPSDQTVDLGFGGGSLRGTDTGSVVLAAGAGPTGDSGGYVYLRPNGSANPAGQLAVYKNGFTEMAGARIGTGSGDGKVLCELYSERPWQFKQGGTEGQTGLELHDITGGKEFRLTNVANPNKIVLNPTGSWIYAAEFRGKLTGNADTASKLAAPRAINGTNFDGTNGITTATWGTARNVQIGNATKSVNGGANVSFTLAEIGAGSAADVAARVAYLRPTTDDDSWTDTWDALRINRQGSPSPTTMPAQYTIAWSLPSYDNSRGLAIAADYGGGNRFWMRSRRDTAPADQRWKGWVELWTSANFDPANKANLSGADFTGGVSTPWVKAKSNNFMGGPVYAVLSPDGTGGQVLLRPNGAASAVGQLKATVSELSWDGKGIWHSGNLDPATKANRIPGQVIMFAGKAAPSGTLLCNGAAVSRTTYAELFAAIGTLYGAGDGKTTFNLPAMLEGTVVTHTQKPETVGTATSGEVLRHTHGASSASAGTHSHGITINGGGGHSHAASAGAAGEHTHAAWTDGQGSHAHTVRDPGHSHTWSSPNHGNGNTGWKAADIAPLALSSTSHSYTGIWLDEAGHHSHNVGMNGSGNHTHEVSVAAVGDHAHSASAANGGAHSHTIAVSDTGGDRNLPAGLRMIYCITY